MKICTKCKICKSLDFFTTNKKSKDKKHSWCKECVNETRRINRFNYVNSEKIYKQNNKEKIKKYQDERRKTDSYKKIKSESDKIYREKKSEQIKERKRIYYADKQHLRRAEYQRNKQGYIARSYQRIKNIKCLTPKDADIKKIQSLYDEAKRMSQESGVKYEVDHIIPVSLSGLHHQDNLQILPWIENRKKGNKLLEVKK